MFGRYPHDRRDFASRVDDINKQIRNLNAKLPNHTLAANMFRYAVDLGAEIAAAQGAAAGAD